MVKHEHAHRPHKLIQKIHKQLKRQSRLYYPPKTAYNFITAQREESPGRWRKASKSLIDEAINLTTNHLWYPHLNMSKDELRSLVMQEYKSMRMWELIDE